MIDTPRKALGHADTVVEIFFESALSVTRYASKSAEFAHLHESTNSAHFEAYLVADNVDSKRNSTTVRVAKSFPGDVSHLG